MASANGWDLETDIVVVGSGAGGMVTAIVAAKNHADVLMVEKGNLYGGTSATSGGVVWVPATYLALKEGAQDSPEEGFQYIRALTAPDVPDENIWAFVRGGPEMMEWLETNTDVKYKATHYVDYHPNLPGGKVSWRSHDPLPINAKVLGPDFEFQQIQHPAASFFGRINWTVEETGPLLFRTPGWQKIILRLLLRYFLDVPQRLRSRRDRFLTLGSAMMARLKLSFDKAGAKLWRNTPMKELIFENGRVTGVVIEHEGKRMRVHARKGVVLAAGGFERSAEMRKQYLPVKTDWSGSQPYNTGDGIRAATAIGAATARMDSAWWGVSAVVPGEEKTRLMTYERSLPGCIMVNQAGKRYMNEASSYHVAGHAMIQNDKPGASTIPSYTLFDTNYRNSYPMGPILPGFPDWTLSSALRKILIKGNSWEEVAKKAGLPVENVKATIERFNADARVGKDTEFGRGDDPYDRYYGDPKVQPNPTLRALDRPPFYAFPVYPGDIGTNGGLLVDERAQVIDMSGKPIPGLYACGNTTASVMGYSYPAAGATLGPAMTFGYLAARHLTGANE